MEDDEDEELIGEEGAELIGADDAAPAKKGLLGKCLPKKKGKKAKYGEAGPSGAKRRFGGRRMSTSTRGGGGDVVDPDEPMLYALTWAQPQRFGTAPSPRNGHSMVLIGMHLYIFAGGDESISFNDVHTLHVGNLTWDKPVVHGTLPSPRSRHSATALGTNMVVFGGVGGGNDLHILETDTLTWYIPKVGGEPPLPRFGHTATLVESKADQTRKLYIFGGHDGRRSQADLHIFDTEAMTWSKAAVSGRAPVAGSRHTTTLVGERLLVLGASSGGTFKEMHVLDIDALAWQPIEGDGQAPIARSRHTSTLVGKDLLCFGGVGGGRPLNDLYVLQTGGKGLYWTEPPVNGVPPNPRVGHASALVGTKMFVFGGHDGKTCLNDVHILVTMNWRVVPAKGGRPNPRVSPTLTHVGNKLVLLGGAAHNKPLNDVREMDLETAMWTVPTVSGTPPPALVGHSSTLIGSELFVFGGSDGKHDGNELHVFDCETHMWSMPSLEGRAPLARVGHSGTAVGSTKIYYFGGYGIRIGYVNETHVLDTALLSWSRPYINGAPPAPRVGHTAIVIGTKLYVIGGAAFGRVLGDLHVLDTTSMSWIEPPTAGILPGPLYGHTAVAVGRCIFVFGGASAMPTQGGFAGLRSTRYSSNRIHVLDVDTMTWSKPNVAGVTPLARHRHATCVVGSQLFMFGGVGGGAELYALDTGIMDDSSVDRDLSKKKGKRQGGDKRDESGNELIAWLEGLGLGKYTRVFIRQEVDFETLVELTPADLREMGIAALGPRKKLAAAISSMKGVGQGKFSTADLYQGRYKLEESTSMGGLNLVKLAIDMKTERKVALKFMADKEGFVREVAFLKALRSEFVVELVDYYEDPHGKQHCVVLEYGEQSLADYLKKGALQRNERKFIADRLANVALHLHSHNVVHCDLKPHNLVLFGLKWKVIDLESARRAGEPVSMKVSPSYCSPELARAVLGKQADRMRASCALDMWSYGLVLFELFARQPFFSDKPDTMQQLASYAELEVPKDIVDDIQARHLLKKLLVKNHADRASVQAVLKHAYLCGGMDTIQRESSFGYLQQTQEQLQTMLTELSGQLR